MWPFGSFVAWMEAAGWNPGRGHVRMNSHLRPCQRPTGLNL